MLLSIADAAEWAEHGMGGIDFENASNTVCRHQIAKDILDHIKVFSGFFSVLYNRPSKLNYLLRTLPLRTEQTHPHIPPQQYREDTEGSDHDFLPDYNLATPD